MPTITKKLVLIYIILALSLLQIIFLFATNQDLPQATFYTILSICSAITILSIFAIHISTQETKSISTLSNHLQQLIEGESLSTLTSILSSSMPKALHPLAKNIQTAESYIEESVEFAHKIRHIESQAVSKREIEKLHAELLLEHNELSSSIDYAEKIQVAILSNLTNLPRELSDCFVFFRPRDTVSGDFYWQYSSGKHAYIAAVDCTGHGVPGALLSVIGYFTLNHAVRSINNATPAQILEFLDESVKNTLMVTPESVSSDGMDIALCQIDIETQEVVFAGAHRPMIYVNKEGLQEIKGDRLDIGSNIFRNDETKKSYTDHTFSYEKGDTLYLFSDGLPDQMGGSFGKKYMMKRVRKFIDKNNHKTIPEIYTELDIELTQWMDKSQQSQVDDILFLGVRL